MTSLALADGVTVALPDDLPSLVARCGNVQRETAERFVAQHGGELISTLAAGCAVLLIARSRLVRA